jgi:predicted nucleotidyltransferase
MITQISNRLQAQIGYKHQGAIMRSEQEMLDLILTYARDHDDVRAVVMNGSRVNPNARKDPLQDYDIVYYVRDVEPFRRNMDVVLYFGEIMILQLPEDMSDPPAEGDGHYSYLMQFMDGNRIDLSFYALNRVDVTLKDRLRRSHHRRFDIRWVDDRHNAIEMFNGTLQEGGELS